MGIYPQRGVIRGTQIGFLFALFLFWQGCSDAYEILEEDGSVPIRFKEIELVPRRQAGELGLLVRMRLDGYGQASPSALVRCRVLDEGQSPQQNLQYFSTFLLPEGEDSSRAVMVQPELAEIAFPGMGNTPRVELFLPFNWWESPAGEGRLLLELDMLEGKPDSNFRSDFPRCLLELADQTPIGHIKVDFPYKYPDLHAVQVWVRNAVLDTSQFDPHSSDAYLLAIGPTYGYPDLYWSLGLDEQVVHRSARWKNSIAGVWKTPSAPFFIDGQDASLQLCLVDWDDDRFFNNRSDAISCWEGMLSELSPDTTQPTFLDMPLVGQMEVVALWNE